MNNEVTWEAKKVLSTPVVPLVILAGAVFCLVMPTVTAFNLTGMLDGTTDPVEQERLSTMARFYTYSFVGRSGYFAPFLIGVIVATSDFPQGSLARSVMLFRSRASVYLAKVTVVGLASLTAGLLAVVANFAGVAAILNGSAHLVGGVMPPEILGVGWRTVAVCLLWGLIGLGLGFLIRSQMLAVVVVFLFTLLLEPLLTSLSNENPDFGSFGRFLPGAANWAVVWPVDAPGGDATMGSMSGQALEVPGGFAVLAAYAVVLLVAGYVIGLRKRELPV